MNEKTIEQVLSQVPGFIAKIHGRLGDDGKAAVPGDSGERARLKRARRSVEAYAFEATARLFPTGHDRGIDDDSQRLLGALAILLTQVRGEGGDKSLAPTAAESAARDLGLLAGKEKENGGSPKLSRLRFGRMLRATDADERLRAFRDLLPLLGIQMQGDFDRKRLAAVFLRWHQAPVQFAFARGYFASLNREAASPAADEIQVGSESTI